MHEAGFNLIQEYKLLPKKIITDLKENYNRTYKAHVEISDKQNDLAIIKITDPAFVPLSH